MVHKADTTQGALARIAGEREAREGLDSATSWKNKQLQANAPPAHVRGIGAEGIDRPQVDSNPAAPLETSGLPARKPRRAGRTPDASVRSTPAQAGIALRPRMWQVAVWAQRSGTSSIRDRVTLGPGLEAKGTVSECLPPGSMYGRRAKPRIGRRTWKAECCLIGEHSRAAGAHHGQVLQERESCLSVVCCDPECESECGNSIMCRNCNALMRQTETLSCFCARDAAGLPLRQSQHSASRKTNDQAPYNGVLSLLHVSCG